MANGERAIPFSTREDYREQQFKQVWVEGLDDVFADVASSTSAILGVRAGNTDGQVQVNDVILETYILPFPPAF